MFYETPVKNRLYVHFVPQEGIGLVKDFWKGNKIEMLNIGVIDIPEKDIYSAVDLFIDSSSVRPTTNVKKGHIYEKDGRITILPEGTAEPDGVDLHEFAVMPFKIKDKPEITGYVSEVFR